MSSDLHRWLALGIAEIGFALAIAVVGGPSAKAAETTAPNIVVIVADDLGWSDLGCYGSEIATPNLDRLAAEGLRFTQCYNAARCCPTRAALLTGLYPHAAGVGHMLEEWRDPGYTGGLRADTLTIAERLRTAGYRNYHVGKWHVGGVGARATTGRNHPLARGFDHAYGTGGGGNYFHPRPLYDDHEDSPLGKDFYATTAFSTYAVNMLDEHHRQFAGQPFFLHLCYTAPHFPLQALPADIDKYRGRYRDGWNALRQKRLARQKELGLLPLETELSAADEAAPDWDQLSQDDRDGWELRMAVYAAMIDCMDQGVGQVLSAIERMGATEQTLVMFLSDNGASAEALDTWPNPDRGHQPGTIVGTPLSHRCLEVGWANAANTPFREYKMWVHEGGISTPLLVRWPKGIAARGAIVHEPAHVIDVLPTLVEIAGAPAPPVTDTPAPPVNGVSLVPALRGSALPERTLAWEHEGNRALRSGKWKLVAKFRQPWELYDLSTDRVESHDLASEKPELLKQLIAAWQTWADTVGVVDWEDLPGASYQPSAGYRKRSEFLSR